MILYLVFGVFTTAINTVCYAVLYEYLKFENTVSTIIAWFIAVTFAFATNRTVVFESHRKKLSERIGEFASFFGCRLLTGIMDVIIMVVAVDFLKWNSVVWKIISNIVVTIINYVASKFFIFRNNTRQ